MKGFNMAKNYIVEGYELDKNQIELLECDTNAIVIAGAGSGKTLTIIGKINYLIEQRKCMEEEILVISFTNASTLDILKRIKYNVDVYTFHKLAITILQKSNYTYKLCSEKLLKYIIEECLATIDLKSQKQILKYLKTNMSYSSFLKSPLFDSFCKFISTFVELALSGLFISYLPGSCNNPPIFIFSISFILS